MDEWCSASRSIPLARRIFSFLGFFICFSTTFIATLRSHVRVLDNAIPTNARA